MRIIGGSLKGRKIDFLKTKIIRPLKDSVKENIFNILNHSSEVEIKISNSEILDLYSGIGSFGLECISRGAQKVTFIDKDINAINILKKNVNNLSISHKVEIINGSIENDQNFIKKKFNIFFLDPPFSNFDFIEILKKIKKNKNFKKNHIVIIHREKNAKDNFAKVMKLIFTRKYGRSKILFAKFT